MYTLRIVGLTETRERKVATWEQAKKAFYNATYSNPDAEVTLANPEGTVIRIGLHRKTRYSSK